MMSLTFGLFTQVSGSGPLGPLVKIHIHNKLPYSVLQGSGPERLVSGSDDFTLFLWHPELDKKPVARMTGHQQLINDVRFSPDTRLLASASFDKSVKLWDGKTGK